MKNNDLLQEFKIYLNKYIDKVKELTVRNELRKELNSIEEPKMLEEFAEYLNKIIK